jgi:hypothetical protein
MERDEQIAMIRRHVADGERHVASQREVVERLRDLGADTAMAEELLEEFECSLAEHRLHLARME